MTFQYSQYTCFPDKQNTLEHLEHNPHTAQTCKGKNKTELSSYNQFHAPCASEFVYVSIHAYIMDITFKHTFNMYLYAGMSVFPHIYLPLIRELIKKTRLMLVNPF